MDRPMCHPVVIFWADRKWLMLLVFSKLRINRRAANRPGGGVPGERGHARTAPGRAAFSPARVRSVKYDN